MNKQEKKQEKRNLILQAAYKVFSREGLHRGKIADIAREAGIGKGTVYEYFKSKDEIFEGIARFFFDQIENDLRTLIESYQSPDQAIQAAIEYTFDFFLKYQNEFTADYYSVLMEILSVSFKRQKKEGKEPLLAKKIREIIEISIFPLVKKGIEEGIFKPVDYRSFSFIIFAALDGIGLHFFLNPKFVDKEKLKKDTVELIFRGILNSPRKGA